MDNLQPHTYVNVMSFLFNWAYEGIIYFIYDQCDININDDGDDHMILLVSSWKTYNAELMCQFKKPFYLSCQMIFYWGDVIHPSPLFSPEVLDMYSVESSKGLINYAKEKKKNMYLI